MNLFYFSNNFYFYFLYFLADTPFCAPLFAALTKPLNSPFNFATFLKIFLKNKNNYDQFI